jgi:hypothetical protein
MTKFKEQLIEILKTNPEVKKDMEEWRFWTVYNKDNKDYKLCTDDTDNEEWNIEWRTWSKWPYTELRIWGWHIYNKDENWYFVWTDTPWSRTKYRYYVKFKIIWTLQERHLRMYFTSNIPKKYWSWIDMSWKIISWPENIETITTLDNTKDFNNQSEEVYEKIFNFLNK